MVGKGKITIDFDDTVTLNEKNDSLAKKNQTKPVWITLASNVAEDIQRFASSDVSIELGGILLGDVNETHDATEVSVVGSIEAKFTESMRGSITFTHATWDYMHAEKEKKYPELKIVGWFHTHPGFGIFLSSYDMFIHKNFFNIPWQIAYVVDPKADTRGFFCWEGDTISPCKFSIEKKKFQTETRKLGSTRKKVMPVRTPRKMNYFAAILAMLIITSIAGWFFWNSSNSQKPEPANKVLETPKVNEPEKIPPPTRWQEDY